jgi:transposase
MHVEIVTTVESAYEVEVETIAKYVAEGARLTNLTSGGEGVRGAVRTAEHNRKIGAAQKGKVISAETRAKLSASRKGIRPSPEVRAKLSEKRKGTSNGRAVLSELDVRAIRALSYHGVPAKHMAAPFGVGESTVHSITLKSTWKHVTLDLRALGKPTLAGSRPSKSVSKLSNEDVLEIVRLVREGSMLKKDIAERFGIDPTSVRGISSGKTWSWLTGINRAGNEQ